MVNVERGIRRSEMMNRGICGVRGGDGDGDDGDEGSDGVVVSGAVCCGSIVTRCNGASVTLFPAPRQDEAPISIVSLRRIAIWSHGSLHQVMFTRLHILRPYARYGV